MCLILAGEFVIFADTHTVKMAHDEITTLISATAKEILPQGARVILYGSRARGDFHETSDWDILVLLDKEKLSVDEATDYTFPFQQLGWHLDTDINPLIYTLKEWGKRSFTPFYKNIAKEGILIWG